MVVSTDVNTAIDTLNSDDEDDDDFNDDAFMREFREKRLKGMQLEKYCFELIHCNANRAEERIDTTHFRPNTRCEQCRLYLRSGAS